jgi:twitching motility protein PilT
MTRALRAEPAIAPQRITVDDLHLLLTTGVQHGASDIHLRVGDAPTYRLNGKLVTARFRRLGPADTAALAALMTEGVNLEKELDELQEYDTSYSVAGLSRFRVNVYRQRGSLALVLRIVPYSVPTIESLGLPSVIRDISENDRGLVLVTGATGSGKSSTLAAMINHINQTRNVHILTIEDPIEFLHSNAKASVSQREIGLDTRNFNLALRAALRQDPDVILVGEMRDAESIDIALKAAETGHLVFSTVHTTDATKTIGRLLSVFPAEEQMNVRIRLSDNIKATVSQRLLPKAEGKGRVPALEIMIGTSTIRELIREGEKKGSIRDTIEKGKSQYGMQSFDQHLAELCQKGVITLETALHYATSPSDLQRSLSFE